MQGRASTDGKVPFAFDSGMIEIKETNSVLGGGVPRDVSTGAIRDLDVTGLFIAIDHDPHSGPVPAAGSAGRTGVLSFRQPPMVGR